MVKRPWVWERHYINWTYVLLVHPLAHSLVYSLLYPESFPMSIFNLLPSLPSILSINPPSRLHTRPSSGPSSSPSQSLCHGISFSISPSLCPSPSYNPSPKCIPSLYSIWSLILSSISSPIISFSLFSSVPHHTSPRPVLVCLLVHPQLRSLVHLQVYWLCLIVHCSPSPNISSNPTPSPLPNSAPSLFSSPWSIYPSSLFPILSSLYYKSWFQHLYISDRVAGWWENLCYLRLSSDQVSFSGGDIFCS